MIRLAGLDSGKHFDYSALVTGTVDKERRTIKIDAAKRWPLKTDYTIVANEIKEIHEKLEIQELGIEINGVGSAMYDIVHNLNIEQMRLISVNTVGDITDPDRERDVNTMSKPQISKYLLSNFRAGKIILPDNPQSAGLIELKKQLPEYQLHISEAGNQQFYASGNAHDDLVMALLILVHLARRHFERPSLHVSVGPGPGNGIYSEPDIEERYRYGRYL